MDDTKPRLPAPPQDDQPLGTPEEFHQLMTDLAADHAPRRFAIYEEYGDRVDGRIYAWGLAFEDHAWLGADDRSFTGRFANAQNAVRILARTGRQLRLTWIDQPSAAYVTDQPVPPPRNEGHWRRRRS
ncbi:hypothetical protein ACIBF5_01960 [Micromonospora sp. NPDC050417]|uniref:hypothetical protein n=1 Tax=Micromonospora sp. NPDC050417 TaxID=3364280 RepID=UPI003799F2CD